ncbi:MULTISPECIES: PEP-CTERM sorting domain-containing protein [unclassified Lentimonas]|uniref:PEP-CTERM sorting domain-containing protein n=1 Tax=unclassified Lentimonas TaxID=2630993 RepID=UPI0013265CD4|nr:MULTISPECIES: PEP-CTERM sorting domain-containing protein [unclassified Lentimonas]CAA6689522.1 Unannotated [Lentimonas sp. CC10]CAA6691967.1 Unannotated [Lentimonas sp. CC19]CAA7070553.1 Unannotated [Lentimonas sp. CC11]
MKVTYNTIALTAASLICAATVQASTLMVNYGTTSVAPGDATNNPLNTETGFSGTTWNNTGAADSSTLFYADSTAATGITMDMGSSSGGAIVDFSTNPATSATLDNASIDGIYGLGVMQSTVFSGGSSNDFWAGGKFTGLAAGDYVVYIWGNNGNTALGNTPMESYVASGTDTATFDFGSTSASSISNVDQDGTSETIANFWVEGSSYSKTTITISAGESLYFAIDGSLSGANRGFLSGIQVVAVPEPATYATLAGLLSLGWVMVRRRK